MSYWTLSRIVSRLGGGAPVSNASSSKREATLDSGWSFPGYETLTFNKRCFLHSYHQRITTALSRIVSRLGDGAPVSNASFSKRETIPDMGCDLRNHKTLMLHKRCFLHSYDQRNTTALSRIVSRLGGGAPVSNASSSKREMTLDSGWSFPGYETLTFNKRCFLHSYHQRNTTALSRIVSRLGGGAPVSNASSSNREMTLDSGWSFPGYETLMFHKRCFLHSYHQRNTTALSRIVSRFEDGAPVGSASYSKRQIILNG